MNDEHPDSRQIKSHTAPRPSAWASEPEEKIDLLELPNGIRIAHKQVAHTRVAHCGIVLDIGSRDEQEHQQGIAHFWEHMAFKGTTRRRAFHIINTLESVGGELNAYTTKEKICFYASFLATHFRRAADVLCDIAFHPVFPEKEIIKEKGVILEEMSMYADDPTDAIYDEMDELVFGSHPLGRNILGTQASVSGFRQEDFFAFLRENMDNRRIVFTSVGPQPFSQVVRQLRPMLEGLDFRADRPARLLFTPFSPGHRRHEKPISQAHCMIGGAACSLYDEDRIPLFMLVNLLGGPGMSSRLNMSVREKNGLVYDISAQMNSYVDTGITAIHFATEPKSLNRCLQLVHAELKKLREKKLGVLQLHQARQQVMGQLAISDESNVNLMLVIGKNLLDRGQVESLAAIFRKIEHITAEQLMELANQYLNEQVLGSLIYFPEPA